jgi:hypothetical protein
LIASKLERQTKMSQAPRQTEFSPTDFDTQMSVCWAFDDQRFGQEKQTEFTVPQLVQRLHDQGNPMAASEVRRTLGWLYGHGRAKVVSVVDGEEVWRMYSIDDLMKR